MHACVLRQAITSKKQQIMILSQPLNLVKAVWSVPIAAWDPWSWWDECTLRLGRVHTVKSESVSVTSHNRAVSCNFSGATGFSSVGTEGGTSTPHRQADLLSAPGTALLSRCLFCEEIAFEVRCARLKWSSGPRLADASKNTPAPWCITGPAAAAVTWSRLCVGCLA